MTNTSIGYASLQLIPTLVGVTDAVNASLGGLTTAGKTMGKTLGDGIAGGIDQARAKVEQSTDKVSAALKKVEDQAGKTKVAQAQLQALEEKGVSDAGRLAAAKEKVEAALRNEAAATAVHTKAIDAQKKAQDNLTRAEKEAGDAAEKTAVKQGLFSKATEASGRALDGLSEKAKSFAKLAATGLGFAGGLGIIGVTKSLVDMGDTFANVNKTIANATGASGQQLDILEKSVENIGKNSPKSLGDIATALSDVAKTTKLTGDPLETLTKQMLKLDALGSSVDIGSVTQAMRAFNVPADQMSGQLDQIFKVARGAGVPLQEMVSTLQNGAQQLQQFGLNSVQSANLLGGLKLGGLDTDKAMAALNKSLNTLSKQGGDVKVNFANATAEIKRLADSGQQADAIAKASKLFGAKADLPMIKAIQEGRLSLDAMNSSLAANQKGILDSAAAPATLSGAWQLFKNNLDIELKPAAEKLFAVIQNGIKWFRETGVPLIREFGEKLKEAWNSGPVQGFVAVLKDVGKFLIEHKELVGYVAGVILTVVAAVKAWTIAQAALNIVMNLNPIGLIVTAIAALAAGIIYAYNHSETFRKIVQGAWQGIKEVISAVWSWIQGTLWPGIKAVFQGIGETVMWLWHNIIQPAWDGIKAAIQIAIAVIKVEIEAWKAVFRGVEAVVMWLWHNVIEPVWNGIKTAIKVAIDIISGYIDGWKDAFHRIADVWRGLVATAQEVWNGVVEKFTGIVVFVTGLPDKIAAAAKGMWEGLKVGLVAVLNWIGDKWNAFADGISVHIPGTDIDVKVPHMPRFDTGGYTGDLPTKQIAGVVHGGEQVIKASSTKMIENAYPGLLDYMNGNGKLPGFDEGGRVPEAKASAGSLVDFAKGVEGQPYVWGGVHWGDCSGAVAALANFATGLPPFASRFATATESTELAKRGFKTGLGPTGSLSIGWFNGGPYGGHTAATLPNGTHFEMGGNRGNGQFGGAAAGAADRQFTDHAYLPVAGTQLDGGAPTTGSTAPVSGASSGPASGTSGTGGTGASGGSSVSVPGSISGLASWGFGDLGKGIGTTGSGSDLSLFGKAAGAAVGGQVSSLLGVFGVNDSPGWLQGVSKFFGGISIGGGKKSTPGAAPGTTDPPKLYDDGGWLPSGTSLVHNATGSPEPVLTSNMWNVAQDGVKVALAAAKGFTGGGASASRQAANVTYHIQARDTEDAFIRAQRQERERAAAKLSRF